MPKTWGEISEEINDLQENERHYITWNEYQNICENYGLSSQKIDSLSQVFNDLGVFVYFQNNIKLSNTIFLNPEYITKGITTILKNDTVKDNNGKFEEQDLIEIFRGTEYADKQAELISLCEEFKLLFEYKRGHYLIPHLFSQKAPAFEWQTSVNNLKYEYKYQFLPQGIVPQLIVRMYDKIYNNTYWLYGVLLKLEDGTSALIEEKEQKGISIEVEGENQEYLLNIIRYELDRINSSFTKIDIKQKYVVQNTTDNTFIDEANSKMPYALKQISVKDFKGIKTINLEKIPVDAQWIFLTGENGYGKTSFLQSIVAGFVGKEDDNVKIKKSKITIEYLNKGEPMINNIDNLSFRVFDNFVAYGSSRLLTQGQRQISEADEIRVQKTASIFREDGILKDIEEVLIFWNTKGDKEEENKKKENKFKMVKDMFLDILPTLKDIKIESTGNQYTVKYVELEKERKRKQDKEEEPKTDTEKKQEDDKPNYAPVSFKDLAAGYKSIIAMIGDMIIRLLEHQPNLENINDLSGIVIIDEFDLHLHPKWQKKFVEILTKEFPKIQFIVSTHSAIPLLGAPKNSIFLHVDRTVKEGITVKRIDIDIKNLLPNSLLTSPLFDFQEILSTQFDKNSDNLRTENYFSSVQDNLEVDRRLKNFVKRNKTTK